MAKKAKNNTKLWITLGVVAVLLLSFIGMYNSLVGVDTAVDEAWGNIETQYQRRADLIPNLVETVKAYSDYEGDLLTEITNARSAWSNAGSQTEQMAAANGMDSALSRLLVTVENYPNLKANENYLSLQDELAGTENRISVARTRYNEVIKSYNRKVRMFPTNMVAGMFGFEQKESFEADEGTDVVPDVDFS